MLQNKIRSLGVYRYLSLFFIISVGFITLIAGCGGETKTGTLSIGLTDATDEYQAVYVTINEVQVHMSGGSWAVVGSPKGTYNLLDLVNGVIEQLGITELEVGDYTQVRLIIGGEVPDGEENILGESHPYANYIIDTDDNIHELKIPSGIQTGIKLVHGFTINEGATVELVLDFDACRSVVKAGDSGQWLLKPTIKVVDIKETYAISGIVTDENDNDMEGVLVSAQIYDDFGPPDKKDEVIIQASTITDEYGSYYLLVEPGVYNVVAYKDDYSLACANVLVESGSGGTDPIDFILNEASTGTVSGNVEISDDDPEASAVLSFRQAIQCKDSDSEEIIEIKSLNITEGGYSGITLPSGTTTYTLVASSEGKTTQEVSPIDITAGDNTEVDDIIFP
jgi:hypothetical protein